MDESGIDMKFDLTDDFDFSNFFTGNDPVCSVETPQDFMYYELKSKTLPQNSPTFKSVTPTSRTHLKLQLMREQHQEQQRREAAKQFQEKRESSNSLKVPVAIQNVGVPPQVLQVTTALENPTRYHVIQKQKNQVRQYLSESFQQPLNTVNNDIHDGKMQSAPAIAVTGVHPSSLTFQQVPHASFHGVNASPETILSPGISSVATSTSEAEDFIEDILSYETSFSSDAIKLNDVTLGGSTDLQLGPAGSLYDHLLALGSATTKTSKSCPPDLPQIKSETARLSDAEINAIAKDRQKKDNHNMIERRRRFNINDRIKELGTLLPKSNDPYHEIVRDVRPNKGTILKSSVDYIKVLKSALNEKSQGQSHIRAEKKQLIQIARSLVLRIQELESVVKTHGIPVSDSSLVSSTIAELHKLSKDTPLSFDKHPEMQTIVPETSSLSVSELEDLMDDDHPVTGDPMLSSPLVPSPGPSDHHISMDTIDSIDNMNHVNGLHLDDDDDDDDSFVSDMHMM